MKFLKSLLKSLLTILLVLSFTIFAYAGSAVKLQDTNGRPQGLLIVDGKLINGSDSGLSLSKGDIPGHSVIHKFGAAPDFDEIDTFVDVWDGANDASPNLMTYIWSTSAIITQLTSSAVADTESIEIQGLNSNWELTIQTLTLNGRNIVNLTTPLIRVFRVKNVDSTDLTGTVYVHETGGVTDGVPDVLSRIKAMIAIGNNQTLMAIYTIPEGCTGYMRRLYADGANGTFNNLGQSIVKLFTRSYGGVFQIKYIGSINSTGTSHLLKEYPEPKVFAAKTDIIIKVSTSVTASSIAAGFDLVLEQNE